MTYTARYQFDGQGPGMNYLQPGDILKLQDGRKTRVLWVQRYKDEVVVETDLLGIVYARELERVREVVG